MTSILPQPTLTSVRTASVQTTSVRTDHHQTGPSFVLRITGLPVHHVERLRFAETSALIRESLEHERWLEAEANALSDALFELIGGLENATMRGPLIALRRSIFNRQAPKQLAAAREHLDAGLLKRITEFGVRRERQLWVLQNGQRVLETEWAALRRHIADSASQPEFQRGVLLSSKDLYGEMLGWLADPPERRSKRKLELSLVQYITRATTKTSPFSTFTSLARGRWRDKPAPINRDWTRQGYGELSRSVANQLMQTFAHWTGVRDRLYLRQNPSLERIGDQWRFLAWRGAERIGVLPHQPVLQAIVESLEDSRTYGLVLRRVFGEDPDLLLRGRDFLDKLIGLGILELHYGMTERDTAHFEGFFAQVDGIQTQAPEVWDALERLRAGLELFEYLPSTGKQNVDRALAELCNLPVLKERGLTMPSRNTIFEDTCVPDIAYSLEPDAWKDVLADLERLSRIYALRDPLLAQRQNALEVFVRCYGAGAEVSLLDFYQRVQTEQNVSSPDLATIPGLLEELNRYAWENHGVLDRGWVDRFTARFPAALRTPRTTAYYAQPLIGVRPGLVVNAWQSGAGRAKARLRRFERKLGLATPNDFSPASREGCIAVDLGGVFGTNVNLREPLTEYEIPFPGYGSDRAPEKQISLSELRVRHCPREQRLRLITPKLEPELEPIHTGLLGEVWLPPIFKFLIASFGAGPIDPTVPRLRPLTSGASEVLFTPRLRLGDVVIERGRWSFGCEVLPQPKAGEPLFQYLRHLSAWRERHGIPTRVFIQKIDGSSAKPSYLDFESAFSVELVQRQLNDQKGFIVLSEILPDLGESGLAHQDGVFVQELVLETRLKGWSL